MLYPYPSEPCWGVSVHTTLGQDVSVLALFSSFVSDICRQLVYQPHLLPHLADPGCDCCSSSSSFSLCSVVLLLQGTIAGVKIVSLLIGSRLLHPLHPVPGHSLCHPQSSTTLSNCRSSCYHHLTYLSTHPPHPIPPLDCSQQTTYHQATQSLTFVQGRFLPLTQSINRSRSLYSHHLYLHPRSDISPSSK